jgi:hypothetical protein
MMFNLTIFAFLPQPTLGCRQGTGLISLVIHYQRRWSAPEGGCTRISAWTSCTPVRAVLGYLYKTARHLLTPGTLIMQRESIITAKQGLLLPETYWGQIALSRSPSNSKDKGLCT